MEITEVRIKLMDDSEDRLRAFCSITFDHCFVVRDLKIIEGTSGPFVAMPSRKLTFRCNRCGAKNHIRSNYCNNCGSRLRDRRSSSDDESPSKLYADVAHPINQECRDMIQEAVIREYTAELERAKQPGYVSRYDDSYESQSSDSARPSGHVPKPHLKATPAADSSPARSAGRDQQPPLDSAADNPESRSD
ncbi:MAG: stage V sporulation protein G [Planctomycetota bacterium]|nr:MAG: stage V sporulation protein G [Planctomycetota bacterium]